MTRTQIVVLEKMYLRVQEVVLGDPFQQLPLTMFLEVQTNFDLEVPDHAMGLED